MMLRVVDSAAVTDVGRVRKANEDSYHLRAPLFVVADGMGGAQAGEVASKIAADAFDAPLDESLPPEERMAAVVRAANEQIHSRSVGDRELHGMGTTLTAVLLGDDEITIAHVGDSRAYRLRDGELTRLTRDHSLVGEMVRRGAITEAEAEVHPQRSILTRALGPEPEVEVDTLSHGVRDGDVYLLCSDGLTGMVAEDEIRELAASGRPLRAIADDLIRRANENGGVDNITVVAFKVGGGPLASDVGDEQDDSGRTVVGAALPAAAVATADTGRGEAAPATGAPRSPRPAATAGGARPRESSSVAAARQRRAQTRRPRLLVGAILAAIVIGIGLAGAIVGSMNVFFIGVDDHGLVTMYRGLPYELPLSLNLYTREYVSSVPLNDLPEASRDVLLDHKLRSRADASDLIRQAERGRLGSRGP